MSDHITLQFLGAARTVTGSKYLLNCLGHKILIDCGIFQGLKELRLKNWDKLPVDASTIDMVLLTHGHLDHCGYLPRLVAQGFEGPVLGTEPTLQVASIVLKDSAKIQEEEAERANRGGYSKHHPALALYTRQDAEQVLGQMRPAPLDEWTELFPEVKVRFRYAGHILGASWLELDVRGKRLVFSGDVGRSHDWLMRPPAKPDRADVLLIESTYGNRRHATDPVEQMCRIIGDTVQQGGTVILPAFAVERAQTLMYLLVRQLQKKNIPDVPIYLDGPMSQSVLQVFDRFPDWHKLKPEDRADMNERIQWITEYTDSIALARQRNLPKIVIAGSGMATGGRVLLYMQHYLDDERSTILFSGFQAAGTRGRRLVEGEPEIKIFGQFYPVRARIENIDGLSAHADQAELLHWLDHLPQAPGQLYITHGEEASAQELQLQLEQQLGWQASIPLLYEVASIPLD